VISFSFPHDMNRIFSIFTYLISLQEPLQAGLIASYRFDDNLARFRDDSGNGNTLTGADGALSWGSTTGWEGSGGYDFSDGKLIAPINTNPAALPKMTWGAWVRTDDLGTGRRKILGSDNGGWDRVVGLDDRFEAEGFPNLAGESWLRYTSFTGSGGPVIDFTEINANGDLGARPVSAEHWTFIAASYDQASGTVVLYLDLDASTIDDPLQIVSESGAVFQSGAGSSTSTFSIGGLSPGNNNESWQGAIDNVFVYDEVLSPASIKQLRDEGLAPARPPIITEFLASNGGVFADGNGDFQDWIEIQNPNVFSLDLTGYILQDSSNSWSFPSRELAAGEYLIVFASGQNSNDYIDPAGYLHTNFALSADGEVLRLLDRDGATVLQEFPDRIPQRRDISWGVSEGSPGGGYQLVPTPLGDNGPIVNGFVEDTKFSIGRGFYESLVSITISSATPGASISYTTDGSLPSVSHGTTFTPEPGESPSLDISVNSTTTLRAMAFLPGFAPTNVDTNTYLFLENIIDQPAAPAGFPSTWGKFTGANGSPANQPVPADYFMNQAAFNTGNRETMKDALRFLPTISLVGDPAHIFSNEGIYVNPFANVNRTGPYRDTLAADQFVKERPVSIEWFQPDGLLEDQVDCGARLIGGWSRHMSATPKKSLRLSFKGVFGATKWNFPLFGEGEVDEFDRVNLRATFSDGWVDNARPATYLRDPFVRETFLAMGGAASRGTFVHLYINGLYWGIYNPTERPDADYAASHYGGDSEDYDALKHKGLSAPGNPVTEDWEVLDGSSDRYLAALNLSGANQNDQGNYEALSEYVDMSALADYLIVNMYLANIDWPAKNWYAFGKRDGSDGGFKFVPWDSEYSLQDVGINLTGVSGVRTPARFFSRVRNNPEFRLLFGDRLHRHVFNSGPLSEIAMVERFLGMTSRLDPAIGAEAARWGDNPNTRQGVRNFTRNHWINNTKQILNNFLPNRGENAMNYFRTARLYPPVEAPVFSQQGGSLVGNFVAFEEISSGSIFYTLDGSDPRLVGGEPNPSATSVGAGAGDVLIPFEASEWKYLTTSTGLSDSEIADGSMPHPSYNNGDWKHPDFDDEIWADGQALLGYGRVNGRITRTEIPSSAGSIFDPKNVTAYFRKEFALSSPTEVARLNVSLIADDAAILYINGFEMGRFNLPAGNLDYNSVASGNNDDEGDPVSISYNVPAGVLREGMNVLAVEVHQSSATSSDFGVDVELSGVTSLFGATLAQSASLKARYRAPDGTWSALNEAFFTVDASPASRNNLVISELNYRPASPTNDEVSAGFQARKDFEYLELMNVGPDGISLAGVRVSEAVSFVFPSDQRLELAPGERGVIVSNVAAFAQRYGSGVKVLGVFSDGKLSDDGELLLLSDATGEVIWRFTYNDAAPWPDSPDGAGPALVFINPGPGLESSDFNNPASWRPSATSGGSPGQSDQLEIAQWLAGNDPLADPDGDGVNRMLAFAVGSETPAEHLPGVSIEPFLLEGIRTDYLVLTVHRNTAGGGIVSRIQESLDLDHWSALGLIPLTSRDNGNGTFTQRFRSRSPIRESEDSRKFFRLHVALKP